MAGGKDAWPAPFSLHLFSIVTNHLQIQVGYGMQQGFNVSCNLFQPHLSELAPTHDYDI